MGRRPAPVRGGQPWEVRSGSAKEGRGDELAGSNLQSRYSIRNRLGNTVVFQDVYGRQAVSEEPRKPMDKMSERKFWTIICVITGICSFILGVSVGNYATRKVLQGDQTKILRKRNIVPGSEFCSIDGKKWWPAREDGQCYAIDKPR